MSVGANGLNILDFMARYETRNNGSKKRCIHDLILQAQFQKNLLLFLVCLSRLNYTE
jgi:hypothetical protein